MVFLNGLMVGLTKDPMRIVRIVRAVRRTGFLNEFVSVSTNAAQRSVFIASDGGRLCRPYIIVENGRSAVQDHHVQVCAHHMTYANYLMCRNFRKVFALSTTLFTTVWWSIWT
jgi:DNA-directed RNA polymerase III subunit RPC2